MPFLPLASIKLTTLYFNYSSNCSFWIIMNKWGKWMRERPILEQNITWHWNLNSVAFNFLFKTKYSSKYWFCVGPYQNHITREKELITRLTDWVSIFTVKPLKAVSHIFKLSKSPLFFFFCRWLLTWENKP